MGTPIERLTIEGFKSIRKLEDFEMRPLNLLIGANGAGKSNFISFFRLLSEMAEQHLQFTVAKHGGADAHLYLGPKVTEKIVGKLYFGVNGYEFVLVPEVKNRLIFGDEKLYFAGIYYPGHQRVSLGSGHDESKLKGTYASEEKGSIASYVYPAMSSWVVYHFHDTSDMAAVKRRGSIRDNERLRPDAANLAAFLMRMQKEYEFAYRSIRDIVRLAAPFFDDFKLRPTGENHDEVELEWTQVNSDYPFHVSQLSDGTLRFICLATALLQPDPPSTILIDEPELGLHPYALTLLASLFKKASHQTQIIVSTQSAPLLDHFEPEDVIVVDRDDKESTFSRLDEKDLQGWLQEYTLGELWQKNILGGRPK